MSTSPSSKYDHHRDRRTPSSRRRAPSVDSSEDYSNSDSNSGNSSLDSEPKDNKRSHASHRRPKGDLVSSRTTRTTKSKDDHRQTSSTNGEGEKRSNNHQQPQEKTGLQSHNLKDDFLMSLGLAAPKSQYHMTKEDEEQHEQQRAQLRKAVQAAITAGAVEAWRTRGIEGSKRHKALRVALAAGAAGGLDVLVARNISNQSKFAGIAESVLGGMAASSTLGGQVMHKRAGGTGAKVGDGIIAVGAGKLIEQTEKRSHRMSQKLASDVKRQER